MAPQVFIYIKIKDNHVVIGWEEDLWHFVQQVECSKKETLFMEV